MDNRPAIGSRRAPPAPEQEPEEDFPGVLEVSGDGEAYYLMAGKVESVKVHEGTVTITMDSGSQWHFAPQDPAQFVLNLLRARKQCQ